jgi:hypothetical protein
MYLQRIACETTAVVSINPLAVCGRGVAIMQSRNNLIGLRPTAVLRSKRDILCGKPRGITNVTSINHIPPDADLDSTSKQTQHAKAQ